MVLMDSNSSTANTAAALTEFLRTTSIHMFFNVVNISPNYRSKRKLYINGIKYIIISIMNIIVYQI